ncbi:MAG: hypothetical protein HQK89_08640 [Nitrospirae bacterium]|nr:hypothetical protein [Nitrospirota bacterium]
MVNVKFNTAFNMIFATFGAIFGSTFGSVFRTACRAVVVVIMAVVPAFFGAGAFAMPPGAPPVVLSGETVAVLPLLHHYRIVQEYYASYQETESYLKGHFREGASSRSRDSHHESEHEGAYGDSYNEHNSSSDRQSAHGNYDLQGGSKTYSASTYDATIVEKTLESNAFSGYLESSLSQSGVTLVDNATVMRVLREFSENRSNRNDSNFEKKVLNKLSARRLAKYALTGTIESMRLNGVRPVPDGTNENFSITAKVVINIKLVDLRNNTVNYARSFTGIGKKTFNYADPIPSDDVLDMAFNDLSGKVVESFTGVRHTDTGDDMEYRDSPGKQLVE